ncbi:MAG: hypothetical protein GWN84_00850 [Gammaproteobacteria bacterium]|nr:hypothetical protein [Gammaproteobacteria bacterium]NIR81746.1 hypothetical protein [Gammaproteobacteria bacterium]NIR88549.1 hypothetical protein [Gammaproteobacteria bacterium]NIU02853.1 hypothetical protein [Gammaproteobacteria bacterium]NIV50375.1 hypothetical protein [Gammaproteobacteria bacterium]
MIETFTRVGLTCFLLILACAVAAAEPEVVARLPAGTPPGNVAVTEDGRIFLSLHQFFGAHYRAVELMPDGGTRPFPNEAWATPPGESGVGLHNVLGIVADRQGIVWLLDASEGTERAGRLVGWDTRHDRLHKVVYLAPPVIPENAFLNDLAVDPAHGAIYIADTAGPDSAAIVVVDLSTGETRRVLAGSRFTRPEDIPMVIDGRTIALGAEPARIGVNPITIDAASEWIYFGPMSGRSLYRVRTVDVLDASLSPEALASRVERYGDKPICDGIAVDTAGNVYITDITGNAIGAVGRDGTYGKLYESQRLSWPDGFAVGPDDWVYVVVNQLHRSPPLNGGENDAQPPFLLLRFKAEAPAVPGR